MPPGRPTVEARLGRGMSQDCAHSHHERCSNAECKCDCHSHPERMEARADAARRANATRNAAKAETAPKRPDVKTGAKAAIPAAAAKQIKSEFAFLLWLGDGMVAGAEQVPQWTPEDRLQPGEIEGLTNAVYNELEARAPFLLRWLSKAQDSAPEAALLYTVAMIALPRLARREAVIMGVKITPEFARAVILAPLVAQSAARPGAEQPAAAGVGPVPTSQPYRSDGYGQVDAGGAPAAPASVQVGAPIEAGHGPLRHGSGDPDSARNNGHAA